VFLTEGTIAHYRVLQELGRGGMGVVCKAEDIRLKRMVALKFLPAHLTQDIPRRERLLREARAASSLDHPNICTIHDVEETEDGQIVLVMGYYEGETLSARIRRGRMELQSAVDITTKILSGLKHAHERGVIHRDIKPSNVILTVSGEVKIVDFGLAKLADNAECLTETGALLGTVAYLPPEVLQGLNTDHRGDVWSCGVVFYEMLAGTPPFTGSNSYVVLHAIMHDELQPILIHRPELPTAIHAIMLHALAKSRADRYQSAGEFLVDLAQFTQTGFSASSIHSSSLSVPLREKSIVVLPFVVVGSDLRDHFFSEGLTDEIITDLSVISQLRVICRTSAIRFKDVERDLKKIAAELNVQYVMEGTVRTSGNSLRVTAELINPATDSLVWAEKYSGSLEDIFAIQESVSRRIAEALKLKLSPSESLRLSEKPMHDVRAYEYYLRAKQEILTYSNDGLERALDYLRKGEQIIGENVVLLSAMGQVYWQFVNAGISTDPKYLEKAARCATRILELDAQSGHGHRLLGLVESANGRTQQAVRLLKKSLESNPNDPDTLSWLCVICSLSGKGYSVSAMAQRLIDVDPLTPMWQIVPGIVATHSGEFGRALAPFERALEADPQNPMLQLAYGQVLALNGRVDEAVATLRALSLVAEGNFFSQLGGFYAHALLGDRDAALSSVSEDLKSAASVDLNYAWLMAQAYALIGETPLALEWLNIAAERGFINFPLLHHLDPFLENVRGEPEFKRLMQSTRERWEAFEV
jgi:non-specific serine/threonine protein kinase